MFLSSSNEQFYLISYDIAHDKRRNKVARILKDAGFRVQYSVFEMIIDEAMLQKTLNRLKKVIKLDEDSVRIYKFCNNCKEKITILGLGEITKDEDFYII